MTMPDSLVRADALFGAEDRLRQNGEVLFSEPSKHQSISGQRGVRQNGSEIVGNRHVEYGPTCVIS